MVDLSLNDLAQGIDPWRALAAGTLLVQDYQALLSRLGYIGLLFYWYVNISKDLSIYLQILSELFRSRRAKGGETDGQGKHWTLNIADNFVLLAFSYISSYLFPTHYWICAAFATFLNLFILGHHVVQLWMQTQIARLMRLNTNVWRWRDWLIDHTFLFLKMKANEYPAIRGIAELTWWSIYQLSITLTSESLKGYLMGVLMLGMISPSSPTIKFWAKWSRRVFYFQFWFHDLGKFTNPNPPEHNYTPLADAEDIRVILLYPRFGFGKICCSLLQGPHMRILFYEAISYNWGSMETTEEILVDGCRKKVTRSVYEILTSYSSLFLPKLLWIDALCIDQKNDMEKSRQVPLMKKIYRNAILTTVILGRSPLPEYQGISNGVLIPYRYDGLRSSDASTQMHFQDARLTFDLLKEFDILKGNALRGRDMVTYQQFESLKLSKSKRRQWAALLKLLQHPWFERVWVIQEVALSAKVRVQYGDEIIDWDTLAEGMRRLSSARHFQLWLELEHGVPLSHIQHTSLYNITSMILFRKKFGPEGRSGFEVFGLAAVLTESVYFKATNPRDLIFGVMSLCTRPMAVDYTLPVEDVYLNSAKRLIDDGDISLLLHNSGMGNRDENTAMAFNIQSWVPDWTTTPKYERLYNAETWQKSDFKAGGDGKPIIEIINDKVLAVSGIFVDVVEEIGPVLFDVTSRGSKTMIEDLQQLAINYNACVDLVHNSPHTADPYPHAFTGPSPQYAGANQSLFEALHRTMFLDRKWVGWQRSPAELLHLFYQWGQDLGSFTDPNAAQRLLSTNKDAFYELLKKMDMITEMIKSCCGGRRLFITRAGYIGLCPPFSKQGDLVYIVPGIHVPIILRPEIPGLEDITPSGIASTLRLVGECFVHGLMNNEARSSGVVLEKLKIK